MAACGSWPSWADRSTPSTCSASQEPLPTSNGLRRGNETGLGERVEQRMEVDDAGVRLPARDQFLDGPVVERRVEAEEAPELTWAPTSAPGKTCSRLRPRRSTYSGRGVQPNARLRALAGGCPGTPVLSTGLRTANELGFTPIDLPPLALPSPLIASRAWASSVAIGVPRPSLRTSHAARSSAASPRTPTDRRPRAVRANPRAREPSCSVWGAAGLLGGLPDDQRGSVGVVHDRA